ncbi:MAG: hypothetical protein H7101_09880 [Deinococcales bacterium]|nr:hypothetical protein [Chitinophagaceae bacterium]
MSNLTNHTQISFNTVVETVYNLPLEERLELKTLLEHNIADSRRTEIAANYKKAQAIQKSGKLKFSSNIKDLKKML